MLSELGAIHMVPVLVGMMFKRRSGMVAFHKALAPKSTAVWERVMRDLI